jgi:hypothetical protein
MLGNMTTRKNIFFSVALRCSGDFAGCHRAVSDRLRRPGSQLD